MSRTVTPDARDRLVAEMDRHLPSPVMMAWEAHNGDVRREACVAVGEHQWRHMFGPLWRCWRCNTAQHREGQP